MRIFLLMLQFFTRIPIPMEIPVNEDDFCRGIKFFPVVGLVIGCLNTIFYLSIQLVFPKNGAVILVCLFNLLITGALHLDGLADTCDGVFSARPKEKMLEIMKDSRIGANGAIAIFFDLALKIGFLLEVGDSLIMKTLLLTPVISRTAMVFLIHTCQPARPGGLGALFIGKSSKIDLFMAFGFCLILTFAIFSYHAAIMLGVNLLAIIIFRKYIAAKIGGMTGDTLGAGNEWSEVAALATLAFLH